MPKKTEEPQAEYKIEQEAQPAPVMAEVKLYRVSNWRNVKQVYQCTQCGQFRDTQDQIFDHILLHYKVEQQEEILEKLMKEN